MWRFSALGALSLILVGCAAVDDGSNSAADISACNAGKAGDELSYAEANVVYNCISDALVAGYKQGDKRWINPEYVSGYRSWTQASTVPANPGWHTERFLMTWVNSVGAAEYLKYAENPNIPAGTVIAKESFGVNASGAVEKGPLFFMEKVAAGTSPKTDDWFYSMVSADGVPQAINVFKACVECHQGNFAATGGLGYPVEESRVQ